MATTNVTKTKSKKLMSASKNPKGKTGGISKAPKTALPKAQKGMMVKKSSVKRPENPYRLPETPVKNPKTSNSKVTVNKSYEKDIVKKSK
jgi:hypothetical protein